MKENPDDPRTYKNSDLLAPEGFGEIVGGSERETDNALILERLAEKGESPENYGWYMDLRKYGSVPHSGFGMGMERIVTWVCRLDHIRDAIAYPRTVARVYP
jgi:asparaginyl-tRNA synthetase